MVVSAAGSGTLTPFSANCILPSHQTTIPPASCFVHPHHHHHHHHHHHVSYSSFFNFKCVVLPPPSNPNYILRASSSEGLPVEIVEDSKFVPLNAEDPRYGPPALLLLGFDADEALKIQQLLRELDGEFLKIIYCTEDMITRSLWEAMHSTQNSLEGVKIAKSLPRICFLSGLTGEEMMMFIDAFRETGLKSAAFAALVPNSANKPLQELIDEIMGDHEMLTGEQL